MLVFISILALQVLIIGLGILIGYKRGIGRGIVRLVELILIGVVSLTVGRTIAAKIADTAFSLVLPLLGEEIAAMITASESLSALIVGFVGALLVPILFAVFFGLLTLITKILLKKRSNAIVKGVLGHEEDTGSAPSRYVGMAIGAVSAALVALALFSPVYTALSLVGGLSDESVALIGSLVAAPEAEVQTPVEPDAALAVRVSLLKPNGLDLVDFIEEVRSVSAVAAPLSLNLATATTPEGERYNAVEEAVALTNAVGAAATAINQENKESAETGAPQAPASPISTLTKAASAALPHIAGQPFAKELVASAASTAGQHLQSGGSIAGVSTTSGDFITNIMVTAISEVFAETTTENLSDTTATLFGVDLDKIEEERKTEKELAKESKEAAKESKKAEKEAAKESKKAEKDKDKTSAPETTKAPETPVAPETTKTPEETTTKPVETTAKPDETSKPAESSTDAESTTPAPETTKTPEETTTTAPETTKAPETTAPQTPAVDPTQQAQLGALELLSSINFNNASSIFEDEEQCAKLISAVYVIADNPMFKPMISALGELGGSILKEYSDLLLPHLNDEVVKSLFGTLKEKLEAEAFYSNVRPLREMVPDIKDALRWVATEGHVSLGEAQVELGAICIAARFFTPENVKNPNNLSYSDFAAFLGY